MKNRPNKKYFFVLLFTFLLFSQGAWGDEKKRDWGAEIKHSAPWNLPEDRATWKDWGFDPTLSFSQFDPTLSFSQFDPILSFSQADEHVHLSTKSNKQITAKDLVTVAKEYKQLTQRTEHLKKLQEEIKTEKKIEDQKFLDLAKETFEKLGDGKGEERNKLRADIIRISDKRPKKSSEIKKEIEDNEARLSHIEAVIDININVLGLEPLEQFKDGQGNEEDRLAVVEFIGFLRDRKLLKIRSTAFRIKQFILSIDVFKKNVKNHSKGDALIAISERLNKYFIENNKINFSFEKQLDIVRSWSKSASGVSCPSCGFRQELLEWEDPFPLPVESEAFGATSTGPFD